MTKKNTRRASEILLEACHKLKVKEVPTYVEKNFEEAWKNYDQNNEGWIRFEESHTFMRSFFGRLNKFQIAPGSVSDLRTGGSQYELGKHEDESIAVGKV